MNTIPVDNLADFLRQVLTTAANWHDPSWGQDCEPWYRGQKQASFRLLPGAYRPNSLGQAWEEETMFNRFCTEAGLLIEPHLRPKDTWEWYFAAQHYGLPTRLLDWSEDPLTALFFALRGDARDTQDCTYDENDPPAVWMMEPAVLNEQLHGRPCVYVVDDRPDSTAVHWLPGKCRADSPAFFRDRGGTSDITNEKPMAIHPSRMTRRIQAQAGKFTVHGTSSTAIDELWNSSVARGTHLVKFVVRNPIETWRELSCLGHSRFRLFPEPETLAEHLKKLYT